MLIIGAAVAVGFAYEYIWDIIDKRSYPREYEDFVSYYSSEYGVPENIVYGVIKVESGFRSNAVSHAGAVGLMQITPDTFEWLTGQYLKENLETGMLYDPQTNIQYGVFFLSFLYGRFGDWDTVYAAYNCGLSRVTGWLSNREYSDDGVTLTYIPIKETREYVVKVNKAAVEYARLYY